MPWVQTPNLDRLAVEKINFTRSYGCTVCSPPRSSQQTSYHQEHTFGDRNDPDSVKKAIRGRRDTIICGETESFEGSIGELTFV